jgi:hypothetical protein
MLVLRREWIEADMIAGPAWALEGRTFAAAASTADACAQFGRLKQSARRRIGVRETIIIAAAILLILIMALALAVNFMPQ